MLSLHALVALLVTSAAAHSFVQCTHYDAGKGKDSCKKDGHWPYHPNYVKAGRINYQHVDVVGPLCRSDYYVGGNLSIEAGTVIPKVKAGTTVQPHWSANGHSYYTSGEDPLEPHTGRFAYVWHSPIESPDDTLLDTKPYAQFDWHNCRNNSDNVAIPGSAQPQVICSGNLTLSENLEPGVHTFVWGWTWGRASKLKIEFVTCFQYEIENDSPPTPTIPIKGNLPDTTWDPVYIVQGSPPVYSAMTGLLQTLAPTPFLKPRQDPTKPPFEVYLHPSEDGAKGPVKDYEPGSNVTWSAVVNSSVVVAPPVTVVAGAKQVVSSGSTSISSSSVDGRAHTSSVPTQATRQHANAITQPTLSNSGSASIPPFWPGSWPSSRPSNRFEAPNWPQQYSLRGGMSGRPHRRSRH